MAGLPGRWLYPLPSSPFLKHGVLSGLARGPVTSAVWHVGCTAKGAGSCLSTQPGQALPEPCSGPARPPWVLPCPQPVLPPHLCASVIPPDQPRSCFGLRRCTHLVQDILLGAQVEVRQDAGQAHAGHGQAGLGEAHGQQGSRLALTEAGEAGGEGGKAPCRRRSGETCVTGWAGWGRGARPPTHHRGSATPTRTPSPIGEPLA